MYEKALVFRIKRSQRFAFIPKTVCFSDRSFSALCFYTQNRLFFGQIALAALRLYPKPPVFRTDRSQSFAFIPKTACFSDRSFSELCFYTQNHLFFGQIALAALLLYPKPPVFRTDRSCRLAFIPKTACFSDRSLSAPLA